MVGNFIEEHLQDDAPNISPILSRTCVVSPHTPNRSSCNNSLQDITSEPESPDPLDLFQYPSSAFMADTDSQDRFNTLIPPSQDPRKWNEAIKSGQEEVWKEAAQQKFDSLLNEYNCFTPIDTNTLPNSSKVLGSRFVFRTKRDQHGNITKYKGRLVAQGFTQRPGIDFNETFAPVAKFTSIRTLAALSATYGYHIHQADVDKAYLHG